MSHETKLLSKMIGPNLAEGDFVVAKIVRELIADDTELDDIGMTLEVLRDDITAALVYFARFCAERPEYFKDVKFKFKEYTVEWEYIGEGLNGDYSWSDPADWPHLRANLSWKNKPCVDGSYCTNASTKTSPKELYKASGELVKAVIKAGGVDLGFAKLRELAEVSFPDRVMQVWTHREYKS